MASFPWRICQTLYPLLAVSTLACIFLPSTDDHYANQLAVSDNTGDEVTHTLGSLCCETSVETDPDHGYLADWIPHHHQRKCTCETIPEKGSNRGCQLTYQDQSSIRQPEHQFEDPSALQTSIGPESAETHSRNPCRHSNRLTCKETKDQTDKPSLDDSSLANTRRP